MTLTTTTALDRARAWRCPLSGDLAGDVLDRALAGDRSAADRALTLVTAIGPGDPAAARAYGAAIPPAAPSPAAGPGILTAPVREATVARLYVADRYRAGCPSNAAGRRVGYGLTPAQAVAACEPYANQAPWAPRRAREVLLVDRKSQGEEEVWGALGVACGETGEERGDWRLAIEAAKRLEWTACLRHAVAAGLLAAPAHRPRRDPAAARVTLTARVHPNTRKRLDAARAKTGEGLGELIDRLAARD